MNLELKHRLFLRRYLLDQLTALGNDTLIPEARDSWVPGERLSVKFGDRPAGWVSLPKPSTTASVTDEAKFLAWCEDHAPDAIEQADEVVVDQALIDWLREHRPESLRSSRRVNPYFTDGVLNSLKRTGNVPSRVTGEYCTDVPGIRVSVSDPSPRVNMEPDAHAVIAAAWRSGDLKVDELLALPGGES